MKKLFTLFMMLLAFVFTLKAQQFVSTEPANRNVILEEFTGRNCGYCTDGHRIANEIMAAHPGRVWAINVHTGGYAPTSYPNFNTTDGSTIASGFSISGYPCGVVNRSTAAAQDRGQWNGTTNNQLNQASECNIAGRAVVNPQTRVASITVEVYYTGNSTVDQNYLTVAMLQDSILGSQADYGNYNPTQWVGNQYCHMHILRDVINASAWGDPISPTTQGTLITQTYEYQIPESIGNPNGPEVILDHIFFLAWVSERQQGTATRPILTGCELEKVIGSNDPICPAIGGVSLPDGITCSQTKTVAVNVSNIGTSALTSFTMNVEFEGTTQTQQWEGNLDQFESVDLLFTVNAPFGSHNMHVEITQANGENFFTEATYPINCMEWTTVETEETETEQLKIVVMQDKWGLQTTWEVTASSGTVLGSGGPYTTLAGGNSTQVHMEYVTVPVNECVKFTIYDTGENGICCAYGDGYYKIYDSGNNLIVDGDGAFGKEATHLLSIVDQNAPINIEITTLEPRIVGDNSALFLGSVERGAIEEVGFEYKKLVDPQAQTVVAELNGNSFTVQVDDLELNTMYSVKAFAVVGQEYIYGDEVHFHTWVEGVSELEKSLKVYPNPASDVLTVEGEMTSVEIYNTVGQCLLAKPVKGSVMIDLAGFDNGIYFLRVYNNGETAVRKISVNR